MLRVLLTLILTMLVALPHGICFCPHASAAEPTVQSCCQPMDEAPSPTNPTDNEDHDERHCSCKLIETLACDTDALIVGRDLSASFMLPAPASTVAASVVRESDISFALCDASLRPLPLILCALRI